MAANQKKKTNPTSYPAAFDPSNTTFVQANPTNFREIVQRLTGAPPKEKPVSSSRLVVAGELGPRRPTFKLHERRLQSSRKLEIGIGSPRPRTLLGYGAGAGEMVMASPVSPLEWLARGSPRTPSSPAITPRGILDNGFYLQPSPLSTPRSSEPPKLLLLFPLQSVPRDDDDN